MGVNCCKEIFTEKNKEIHSEPKESKATFNTDLVIKNQNIFSNQSTNRELVMTVKHSHNLNIPFTPIEANDYAALLFQILNNFRAKPDLFANEAIKYDLKSYFDDAIRNEDRPYSPEWSIEKNKMLHDYLTNPQNNDKTSSEKEKDILQLFEGNANGLFFQSIGPVNNLQENIWNLLENNTDEISTILTHNCRNIIIASILIEGTNKLHSSYVLLLSENSFKLL